MSVICDYMFKLADINEDYVYGGAACTQVKGTILFVTFESFSLCIVTQFDDSMNYKIVTFVLNSKYTFLHYKIEYMGRVFMIHVLLRP